MSGKHSRNKGAGGERELCALLSDAFGEKITRKLGQARDSGNDIDLPPYRIEVKRRQRIGNLYSWMLQAELKDLPHPSGDPIQAGIALYERPIVACRADGKGWLIIMKLDEFIKLAREEIAK